MCFCGVAISWPLFCQAEYCLQKFPVLSSSEGGGGFLRLSPGMPGLPMVGRLRVSKGRHKRDRLRTVILVVPCVTSLGHLLVLSCQCVDEQLVVS